MSGRSSQRDSPPEVRVIDTSSLIRLKVIVPVADQWPLLVLMSTLVDRGWIAFPRQVSAEMKVAKHPDATGVWAAGNQGWRWHPQPRDDSVAEALGAAQLTDPNSEAEAGAADPYVVAMALQIQERWANAQVVVVSLQAEGGVVVGQAADLDLRLRCRTQPADPVQPQPLGRSDMVGIGQALMPSPHPGVVGDQPAVAEGPHPIQIGDHLDPAADHRRVHRVVVAVQSHVVVPRQPQPDPPAGRRRNRRQSQHLLPLGNDPIARCAAQRPAWSLVHPLQPLGQLGVEVGRATEAAAGQERGFQYAGGQVCSMFGEGLAEPLAREPQRYGRRSL
jgi:hypothetical protein